jgi:hypothetical protein
VGATVFWQDVNELATISVTFTGTPAAVVLTITDPTGAVTTPSMTGSGAGPYTANIACGAAPGIWAYLVEGTGTASDAIAGTWTVSSPALNQLYATPAELKSRLGNITDTTDDFEILLACQAASRSVDEICGRYFWRGSDVRTYIPESVYRQDLDDLVSVTTLKVDRDGDGVYEETWTQGTDYQLQVAPGHFNTAAKGEQWPYTGFSIIGPKFIPVVWPWSHLDRIQVTGVFGWPAVPLAVKQAALIAASDLFRLKDAPFGVAGFGEFGVVRIQANPRVMSLLHRYISGQRVGV